MLDSELEKRREELARHVVEYLAHNGIVPNSSGSIKCITGEHADNHPSMRIKQPKNDGLFCYTCNKSFDIFDIAHILEGKPIKDREFISENVNYLSEMFGYAPIEVKITKKQEHSLSCERLHKVAFSYFRNHLHYDHAHGRGWNTNDDVLWRLGIGTVDNKDAMAQAVAKDFGCHTAQLYDYGLDMRCFGADKLTFTLFNAKGEPIGFAGRDMSYEKKREAKDPNARKYLNPTHIHESGDGTYKGNPLYYKNKYLYNIHNAKKASTTLLVEGYADVVECELNGIEGAVAAGGTALNREKIQTLERTGLKDVVLGFDYDISEYRAGQTASIAAIKEFRGFPDIRLRVLNWYRVVDKLVENDPNLKSLDVDYFLGKCGAKATRRLISEAIHPIEFQLQEMDETGADKDKAVGDIIEDVASRSTPLDAIRQVKIIAQHTGMDEDLLREEVKRHIRLRDKDVLNELHKIEKKYQKDLYRAETVTDQIEAYANMASEMKTLSPDLNVISVDNELSWINEAEAMSDGTADKVPFAKTGVKCIDEDLGGGIPLNGKLLVFGGKAQVGKTMLQNRLAGNILKLNRDQDVRVFVWTLDDNKETWYYRLLSVVSGLPLYKCQRSYQYIRDKHEREQLEHARTEIRNWIKKGRLVIKDAQEGSNVAVLENYVENLTSKSGVPLVIFFDNFHKTENAQDRSSLEQTAGRIRNLTHKYRVTILANAELRKTGADQSTKILKEPTTEDLKETGKLHYDADYAVILDNPMMRMPLRPDDPDYKGKVYTDVPNTFWTRPDDNEHLPIIWYKREKNKIFNLSGRNYNKEYLKFDPIYVKYIPHKKTVDMAIDADVDKSTRL